MIQETKPVTINLSANSLSVNTSFNFGEAGEIFYTIHYIRFFNLFSVTRKSPHILLESKDNGNGSFTFSAKKIPVSKNYFLYLIDLWAVKRISKKIKKTI